MTGLIKTYSFLRGQIDAGYVPVLSDIFRSVCLVCSLQKSLMQAAGMCALWDVSISRLSFTVSCLLYMPTFVNGALEGYLCMLVHSALLESCKLYAIW